VTPDRAQLDRRLAGIVPRLADAASRGASRKAKGRIRRALGVIVHATVTQVRIGEICRLVDPNTAQAVLAEVIGLMDDVALLTPIGDIGGLSNLSEVVPTGEVLRVPIGSGLLGRVISPLGEALDDRPWPPAEIDGFYPVEGFPPSPLSRDVISEPMQLGVRAIDGLLTCALGQRIGIFGEPGLGKSTLLASIVRGTSADVVVVGLIGERGREVREFIEKQLGAEGMRRSVVVVATSDRPAMERAKAAYVATAIAESFRDRGSRVLLLMDSLTRFARAQREIGLAAGEPPTRRGYPPSLFAALPRLVERAGPARTGAITAIYTVLVEGDMTSDPVAEEVVSLLDGHIVLSRELGQRNHFPAIDVLRSRSRLMDAVVGREHKADAARIRELMARHAEVELLLRVGEYKSGSDPLADEAVAKIDRINAFLRQTSEEHDAIDEVRARMRELVA
jgi:type III secretion protein N (ATPase)